MRKPANGSTAARTTAAGGPLRIALAGCGDVSQVHLDAIAAHPDACLVAVVDPDQSSVEATATKYDTTGYPDLARALVDAAPDIVHICTPHFLHAQMAIGCLEQGVHVLLEKPLAATLADGAAIVQAAQRSSASLGVCLQNRYNTTSQVLRRLLDSGELGAVLGGRAALNWSRNEAYYQRRPWRGTWSGAGGGVLINQAIHTIDLLQWFVGEVESVRGQIGRLALPETVEVEDTAALQLHHRNGVDSIIWASNGYAADAPVLLELITEQARVRLDTDLTVSYYDGRYEVIRETMLGSGERAHWGASHGLLIADFYQHVQAGLRFWIDAAEAMKSLRIVTDAYPRAPIARG